MEKNIRNKIHEHNQEMKENIQKWFEKTKACIFIGNQNKTNEFIQYMNDFPTLNLSKEDFQKRKRLKNNVPDYNRCIALKCNGQRCSRKQKSDGVQFCGTHLKGANYGTTEQTRENNKIEKIELWLQEINGISRYIDKNFNVYCMEDILNSCDNPRIIGKYGFNNTNQSYYMI